MPHHAAGWRIDPAVSVPSAAMAISAATAAALPPLEPPGRCSVFRGFRVRSYWDVSVEEPCAHASKFVFPATTPPAASIFSTTVALYGGTKVSSTVDAAVVLMPLVQ